MSEVAYRSSDETVLTAWSTCMDLAREIEARRTATEEKYGRPLVIVRDGFGHTTKVAGFEAAADDPSDRALRYEAKYFRQVPRLSTAAGKVLARELGELTMKGPDLPGMPPWTLASLSPAAPALRRVGDTVLALWPVEIEAHPAGGLVDRDVWERIPLSVYYAAVEAADQTTGVSA